MSPPKDDESDGEGDVRMSDDEMDRTEDKKSSPMSFEESGERRKRKRDMDEGREDEAGLNDGSTSPLMRPRSTTPPPPTLPPMTPGDDMAGGSTGDSLKRKRNDEDSEECGDGGASPLKYWSMACAVCWPICSRVQALVKGRAITQSNWMSNHIPGKLRMLISAVTKIPSWRRQKVGWGCAANLIATTRAARTGFLSVCHHNPLQDQWLIQQTYTMLLNARDQVLNHRRG